MAETVFKRISASEVLYGVQLKADVSVLVEISSDTHSLPYIPIVYDAIGSHIQILIPKYEFLH